MANPNAPFGFQWVGSSRGSAPVTGANVERKIAAAYATQICKGDLVQQAANGYIQLAGVGLNANQVFGVFDGCKYLSTSQARTVRSTVWPTGDHAYDGTAYITPISGAVSQTFKVQVVNGKLGLADIGATIDINVGTQSVAGGYGQSGMAVDYSTLSAAFKPFVIVDLLSSVNPGAPGTDDSSNNNVVLVRSNPGGESGI